MCTTKTEWVLTHAFKGSYKTAIFNNKSVLSYLDWWEPDICKFAILPSHKIDKEKWLPNMVTLKLAKQYWLSMVIIIRAIHVYFIVFWILWHRGLKLLCRREIRENTSLIIKSRNFKETVTALKIKDNGSKAKIVIIFKKIKLIFLFQIDNNPAIIITKTNLWQYSTTAADI